MKKPARHIVYAGAIAWICGGCALVSPSHHRTEDYTPVFAAASDGDLAAVRAAVQADPDVLRANEWENATLLDDALSQNQNQVANYLVSQGADVNAVKTDGVRPLHIAAQNGNIPALKLLLIHGAKFDALDKKGWTALDRARKWHKNDAVAFLQNYKKSH